jgi:hypothetical protein
MRPIGELFSSRVYKFLTSGKRCDDNAVGLPSQASGWEIAGWVWDYNTGVIAASCLSAETADSAVRLRAWAADSLWRIDLTELAT